ncbi:MAG: DUF1460 domain-containing protein [Saprospiraceae bacterium]|nr:DUF1460 domain-containing protein [Saprospiraceae bacterium]
MKFKLSVFLLFLVQILLAQDDRNIYLTIQKKLHSNDNVNCISIGNLFLGKPYKKNILNQCYPNEQLNTCLSAFDCVTFVETVLSLNSDFHQKNPSFDNFKENLAHWRYKNGIVDCKNRLHYFSDWVQYHENNHEIQNITKELNGEIVEKNLNFMTTNRNKYNFLKNDEIFNIVEQSENNLNKLPFYSIPKEKIPQIESKIKTGDIIGITSTRTSIDIDHVGFAVVHNNEVYLMHASHHFKRVVSKVETLKKYINRHKHHSGIIVLRVLKS